MPMWVRINDRWEPEAEARVSVFDRGFLYGDGVFETMRAFGGVVFRLEAHLRRLRASAAALRIAVPRSDDEIRRDVRELLERNRLGEAVVRIALSRGPGPRGAGIQGAGPPSYIVSTHSPPEPRLQGVRLMTVSIRRISPAALPSQAKHANYLNAVLAHAEAAEAGFDDALMLSEAGWVAECSASNLFWVEGETLYTPALDVGVLPGIVRALVLELASRAGIAAAEVAAAPGVLERAREAFLTNSVAGVRPVREIDARVFESPGPVTARLARDYAEAVARETGQ